MFFLEDCLNKDLLTMYVEDCNNYTNVFDTLMHGENNEVVFV